jgi:hypothetical protein
MRANLLRDYFLVVFFEPVVQWIVSNLHGSVSLLRKGTQQPLEECHGQAKGIRILLACPGDRYAGCYLEIDRDDLDGGVDAIEQLAITFSLCRNSARCTKVQKYEHARKANFRVRSIHCQSPCQI